MGSKEYWITWEDLTRPRPDPFSQSGYFSNIIELEQSWLDPSLRTTRSHYNWNSHTDELPTIIRPALAALPVIKREQSSAVAVTPAPKRNHKRREVTAPNINGQLQNEANLDNDPDTPEYVIASAIAPKHSRVTTQQIQRMIELRSPPIIRPYQKIAGQF